MSQAHKFNFILAEQDDILFALMWKPAEDGLTLSSQYHHSDMWDRSQVGVFSPLHDNKLRLLWASGEFLLIQPDADELTVAVNFFLEACDI